MATTYKSPGVYVEEIPKLPPSVAQVETAIPAFIGYTEKAEKNGVSLVNKALPISSLTEYETFFGMGPEVTYNTYLDPNDLVSIVETSVPYCLYESLKLFYDNGGGKCYIISVGIYKTSKTKIDLDDLKKGLAALEKEDEPTIIVCPDAALMDNGASTVNIYDFQKLALAQCAKLGDRVLLCDLKPSNETTANSTFADRVQDFRDNIGISNLKYGCAYGPYIKSSIPRAIRYRDISLYRGTPSSSTIAALESLTGDNMIIQLIYDLKGAKSAVDKIVNTNKPAPGVLTGTNMSFEDEYKSLLDSYNQASDDAAKTVALKALCAFSLKILAALHTIKNGLPTKAVSIPPVPSTTQSASFLLRDDLESIAKTTGMLDQFKILGKHSNAFGEGTDNNNLMTTNNADLDNALNVIGLSNADYSALKDDSETAFYSDDATKDAQKNERALKIAVATNPVVLKFYNAVLAAAKNYEKTFDESLEAAMGFYKQIKNKIALSSSELPPSGAIAGIYARVDSARGVWKAPANESINSIYGPVIQLTSDEQSSLNVDVVAGKSINAIRTFTGKGTLVWGARTLAGNDNEWRYVNVRRFFNMVEESCKKSTEGFVFEPNDANTWVKVQGMIENFLTIQWRQGALQGAKPEHAFYVAVGLGKTMTSLDILEGRMIVEIGMAVVRPAEFIILKFSHKMAES